MPRVTNDGPARNDFDGRVMLVTGGSRGIGAATAFMAASRGASVIVNYTSNSEAAEQVVESCRAAGGNALASQADISDEAQVMGLFEESIREFGRVDVLVNNAGIAPSLDRLENYTAERIQQVMGVNVVGSFLCAREAVRRMSTSLGGLGGNIVNISSAAAYNGSPNEFIDYAASKGAIDSMTIGLAKEVATDGIRVNAVRPGLIETDIHAAVGLPDRVERLAQNIPMKRGGVPSEVAETILWVASDAASYVTGALINCSGGR